MLSDGDGSTSVAVTKQINITNVNDPPVAVTDAFSTNEDTPLVIAPSTAGLNNWWGFNEGGTSQTTASSGALGSTGTRGSTAGVDASDPSWNSGLLGGAGLSFNGGGQYVQTTSTELSTASAFTLSAWFQTNTTTSAQHLLWQGYAGGNGYGSGGSTSPATSEMSLSIGSHSAAYDNKLVFSLGYDVPANGADSIFIVSASDFSDTTRWHHVAVSVADIGGGVVRASLYVDGRLEGTGTGTQNDRSAWQALRIGAAGDGSRSFNGKIDEVRVYGSELSGAQILAVMQPGVLANDSDPDSAPLQVHPALVSGPSNGTLAIHADGSFTYTPNANFHGTDSFSYRATDGIANSAPATVTITVLPVADTPSVSNATTSEDVQSTSGLVISRNPADGAEVTHFKITGISNGTLYRNDGVTQITNGSFISFADGNAGLKFTPAANVFGSGSFVAQASTSNSDAGLGGGTTTATVTINPVADTPTVTNATTSEDTQTTSGLVITRSPADGPEVSHFKITGINNGTLFLNDGVTAIADGSFITIAQGSAGLKFTPSANFHGNAGFTVQASLSNGDAGLGGAPVNATITVLPVADTPSVSNATTNEDVQSASGLVILRHPADGAEVTHFKITGITNGTLYRNDGTTQITNGSFVTFAEGNAGLKFTPTAEFSGTGSFTVQASTANNDAGLGGATVLATITVVAVNDAPTTTPVTLLPIAEDSGPRLITQAELLANATDVDGPGLSAINLVISSGLGSLVDNGDGSWTYTPALNGDTSVVFSYLVSDGSLPAAGTATLDITPVNDAPTTGPVTLAPIAEDSGPRLITQAELLANAVDVDGPGLTATGLTISAGLGTLVDNGDGTWTYTPALNDDTAVSFSYSVTDGSFGAAGSASLDITPVNDAPTTTPVTLLPIAEDSGPRLITQAELLANAVDVDGPSLVAINLLISSGLGSLVDNGDGTWTYTPALNDDSEVVFSYLVSDGSLTATGTATLDITPVNDAPTTGLVTLAPIAEDSGPRVITQAELLANAIDVDGPSLTATGLTISSGLGSLVDNGDGTWTYTSALNDDTMVGFSYLVTDGSLSVAGSATLDITPVNDTPTTSPVTLAPIAEDSGPRIITQAELLANAADVDGSVLTATGLVIGSGGGSLVDNGDGTWTYTPALNDNGSVTFSYTVSDGSLSAPGSATLDITPVNDAPTTSPVTLSPIAEDSGPRVITQAELLANAADVDGPSVTAINLVINAGLGTLVNNGDGTWTYTPAPDDDSLVSLSYGVTDGSLTAAGTATLDITPVNDAPTTGPVTLAPIAEDSGPRVITQAELLANAVDVDGPSLSAVGLVITAGLGSIIDNGDGTWTYTPSPNDDTLVSFSYSVTDGNFSVAGSASLDITPVNDAPTTSPVTLLPIAEDSGPRVITQAELLANAADVDGPTLAAINLAISSGFGTLVDNGDGTWTFTPALNDDTSVAFSYLVSDGSLTAAGSATLDITPVNDAPTTGLVTLAAIAEDSGPRVITQAELLANAVDVDGPGLTATGLTISSGLGALVDNGDGTWTYTPALNDDTMVGFSYLVTDGSLSVAGSATLDITPVNDAPTTSPVTLAPIAEDSGPRIITQAELLANAADVDGPVLTATGLVIASGGGSLVDNGDGTWTYTPALNDDGSVTFSYTVSDGSLSAPGSATLDITAVNDAPTTSPVTLSPIAEDSGPRVITQAELLANAADVDGPSVTAINLVINAGLGTLVNNGDGTWTYTPAPDDDSLVSFSYGVTDGSLIAAGTATLDITPVNDTPTTSPVTLLPIAEDSGPRLITQAELLANAADVDGPSLTASNLVITSGLGTLVDNRDGTWTYTPALNDDTSVSFSYTVTDGSLAEAGTATLDITPVNDAPTTTPVALLPIAEDSGPRVITQAELLANATDVDGPSLTAMGLTISSGLGTLVDNGDGTWTYTPALNDDTSVSFSYTVTDGTLAAAGAATLDITPVNDAPTTSPVTLAPIAEDSGPRLITQAELLANAADLDGPSLAAINLVISSGLGSLVDNGDGTWTYTPALDDDTTVSFSYMVTDGSLAAASTATLDITPVNDAPTTSPVTLSPIAEDSGPRLITQAELLANAADVDGPGLTAVGLTISFGLGTLVDNGDGTWTYTPELNDDTTVGFSYSVTDGSYSVSGTATLDITPVNDAPTTSPVTLLPIAEDSGARLITQAELLTNATDVDGPSLTAINLAISSGLGTLVDNGDGSWTYNGAPNDDSAVVFSYLVTDGSLTAPGTATIDFTQVNDAPTTSPVTLLPIAEDSGARLITQAELLANAADVDGPSLIAINLVITSGLGSLVDNGDGSWTYTPALNDDTTVSFSYTVTDGSLTAPGSATLDITPVNDAPTTSPVTLAPIAEDSDPRVITQAELLANDTDVDGPSLTALNLVITSGLGTLVDNGDGTWTYTPALNDDTSVSFSYIVTDGSLSAPGSAMLVITPVNDAPTTSPVTLAPIAEDSGPRLITQAELLANAADVDGPSLRAVNLVITSGLGTLIDNGDGGWAYTPAPNDDTSITFSYTVTDGSLSVAGVATLDITPVNDAPTTSPVTLAPIAEDSGPRLITQAELLANAADVDGTGLTAINLFITSGLGTLVDNGDGSWTYMPAPDDDTSVLFSYLVTDGSLSAAGTASLDITPVNDAPTTRPVALAPIAEDSGPRVIIQAELLANASDVDGPALFASGLSISRGAGTLVDNGDGSWSFTPAPNDDSEVEFSYLIGDGSLQIAASAVLDILPVADAPTLSLEPITVGGGESLLVGPALLQASSIEAGVSLQFIVLETRNGRFELADNQGAAVTSFSQADVVAGRVRFVSTSAVDAPLFSLVSSDGQNRSERIDAVIDFRRAALSATVTVSQPAAPAEVEQGDGKTVSATAVAAVANRFGALFTNDRETVSTPSGDDTASTAKRLAALTTAQQRGGELPGEALSAADEAGDPSLRVTESVRRTSRGGFDAMGDFSARVSADDYLVAVADFELLLDPLLQDRNGSDGGLRGEMPADGQNSAEDGGKGLTLSDAARATGLALTAGTVWWALRAGSLLTGLMVSLPAWRHADLLAVLPDEDDEDAAWGEAEDRESARDEDAVDLVFEADDDAAPR
ncbi:cadherin-like domain-containing protein [Piscinibacter sakaiensis]|uniref:cadherin-like domain-containing protein n=1 Tax=Piscinibacter sakaiensis TaxID=1547922 RepID=UPI003AAEC478